MRQEHVDAVNTTDIELLLRGFTDDVVYISPQAAPIVGKEAMRTFLRPIYSDASISIEIEPESLEITGDRGVEWGSCHGRMSLGGGDPAPVNLGYVLVYRRDPDGAWRVSHNISTPGPMD